MVRGRTTQSLPCFFRPLPKLLYSLIRTMMPTAQRIPAQMSPPTLSRYQSEKQRTSHSWPSSPDPSTPDIYLPAHSAAVEAKKQNPSPVVHTLQLISKQARCLMCVQGQRSRLKGKHQCGGKDRKSRCGSLESTVKQGLSEEAPLEWGSAGRQSGPAREVAQG